MKALALVFFVLVGGCTLAPAVEVADAAADACHNRCRLEHDRCMADSRLLCSMPCSSGLFDCWTRCPPGRPQSFAPSYVDMRRFYAEAQR
jgi:hypothetical protein